MALALSLHQPNAIATSKGKAGAGQQSLAEEACNIIDSPGEGRESSVLVEEGLRE